MMYYDMVSRIDVISVTYAAGLYIFVLANGERRVVREPELTFCDDERPGVYAGTRLIEQTAADLLFYTNRGTIVGYVKPAENKLIVRHKALHPTLQEAYGSLLVQRTGVHGIIGVGDEGLVISYEVF